MPETKLKPKVLIIDDDPFILDMYVLKFKAEGFDVQTAQDGKTGLKKIKEQQPNVLLLDVVMPSMDGFAILQELKKKRPDGMKIILLTNLGQKEDIDRGMQLGADDYVIKAHFTPSEVVERVRKIIS